MRRFSASAGGNPQSTKTFSLPFVARITSSLPTIHGNVSSPTRRQGRAPSESSWRRHATHRQSPRTWPRRRRDIHPAHGLESQSRPCRRVESASNRWPYVLPESSSTKSRFRDALPGGTVAGGHDCLRAIGSALLHSSPIAIIQNFYNRNGARSTGLSCPKKWGPERWNPRRTGPGRTSGCAAIEPADNFPSVTPATPSRVCFAIRCTAATPGMIGWQLVGRLWVTRGR